MVLGLAAAGGVLRALAARGELWCDELWSLELVGDLASPGEVFWGLAHDNNHALNSLWLFFAGPDAPSWWMRLPAVLCGTASVIVAAVAARGAREVAKPVACRAAGLAAAALMAFCYPFVDYGSEARGYAGLILAVLTAVWCFEPALATARAQAPGASRSRFAWGIAGAVAFGTLSHLTMLLALGVLGMAATGALWKAGRPFWRALDDTVTVFRPTLVLLLPVGLLIGSGVIAKGGLTVGGTVPFSVSGFRGGFAGLLGLLAGVPQGWGPPTLLLAGAAVAFGIGCRAGWLGRTEGALLVAALLVVPGAMALARMPNSEQPRYFLPFAVVLTVLSARMAGRAWAAGGLPRAGVTLLLAAVVTAQAWPVATLLVWGRGQAGDILAVMDDATSGEPLRYASDFEKPVSLALAYAARGRQIRPVLVRATDPAAFCASPPPWFVHDLDRPDAAPPPRLAAGPEACRATYRLRLDAPVAPLSGRHLALYRLTDGWRPPGDRTSPR